jgi:hypothetical protein
MLRSRIPIAGAGFIEPCLPSLATKPPNGSEWIHEIKHDGYRLMIRRDTAGMRLLTRRGYDWTARFPAIASAASVLRAKSFLIDGEAVCCDDKGIAVFDKLRQRRNEWSVFLAGRAARWLQTARAIECLPPCRAIMSDPRARCPACRTTGDVDLRTLDWHHGVAVTALISSLSCRSCRPHAPSAELVCLSKSSVAEEYYAERSGNRWVSE